MAKERLTETQIVQIALDRFEPLVEGKSERPIKDLVTKWKGSTRNGIASAIRQAFAQKLVEIRPTEDAARILGRLSRDNMLEASLKKKFPLLIEAIVVQTNETASDLIHRDIGYGLARQLRALIPRKATIGVGSGRGPYYVVSGLKSLPPLPHEGIELMSLTGALYPETHDGSSNALLDADFHTGLLGMCFSQKLTQRMISYPIAHENLEAVRRDTWLDKKQFEEHIPTIAIVGVGVLKGRHRFYTAVHENKPGKALGPIFEDLEALVKLTDKRSTSIYCPVADVCNRLFLIDPPEDVRIPQPDLNAFQQRIQSINKKLLTVDEDQLGEIGRLFLVAGTPDKAFAIYRLLKQDHPFKSMKVDVLCTDAKTAKLLIEELP